MSPSQRLGWAHRQQLGAGGSAVGVDLNLRSLRWQALWDWILLPFPQAQALVQYLEEPLTQVAAS